MIQFSSDNVKSISFDSKAIKNEAIASYIDLQTIAAREKSFSLCNTSMLNVAV